MARIKDIAARANVSIGTVDRVRIGRRDVREGLQSALRERPRPAQPRLLTAQEETRIIATVCFRARRLGTHAGRCVWSLPRR